MFIEENISKNTEVRESEIEGKGLFATKDIEKGEIILDWSFSDSWYKMKWEDLREDQIRKNWYYGDEEECWTIDKMSQFSYVNHSRNPNMIVDFPNKKTFAARDIKEGEEIMFDYRTEQRPGRKDFPKWI